jgi:hypothetical protein
VLAGPVSLPSGNLEHEALCPRGLGYEIHDLRETPA